MNGSDHPPYGSHNCCYNGRELTDEYGNMDCVNFEHAIRRQVRTRVQGSIPSAFKYFRLT